MLKLALLTADRQAADAIELMLQDSALFRLVLKCAPVPAGAIQQLHSADADVLLIGLADLEAAEEVLKHLSGGNFAGAVVGFKPDWNDAERMALENTGIGTALHEPFSPAELESAVYDALHKKCAVAHQDILAFLPAKAGAGCSIVALNTAAALSQISSKSVALIESDRRSGVLSIMLNKENKFALSEALQHADSLTQMEWNDYRVRLGGIDLLLANPARRGRLPTWADYYKLLLFLQRQYNFLLFDMPELINEATAEVVKSARAVVVVCTAELPSIKMAGQRCAELEGCEVPPEHIHIVINRWERGGLSIQDIEKVVDRPVFATLPNDYRQVQESIVESRLVAEDSSFTEACRALARKLAGLPEVAPQRAGFGLLKKLGRISG